MPKKRVHTKKITSFYAICGYNSHTKNMEKIDVIEWFLRSYREWFSIVNEKEPHTFTEFREWIIGEANHHFGHRAQYEIMVGSLFCTEKDLIKIDVCYQILENIDLVTRVFIDTLFSQDWYEEWHTSQSLRLACDVS